MTYLWIHLIINAFLCGNFCGKETYTGDWKETRTSLIAALIIAALGLEMVVLMLLKKWLFLLLDLIQVIFYFQYLTGIGLRKLLAPDNLQRLNERRDYFLRIEREEHKRLSLAERHFLHIVGLLNDRAAEKPRHIWIGILFYAGILIMLGGFILLCVDWQHHKPHCTWAQAGWGLVSVAGAVLFYYAMALESAKWAQDETTPP